MVANVYFMFMNMSLYFVSNLKFTNKNTERRLVVGNYGSVSFYIQYSSYVLQEAV